MLTFLTLVVLEELHAFKRGSASNKLMGEFGLMVGLIVASIIVIDLLMRVLSVAYSIDGLAIDFRNWLHRKAGQHDERQS